jgi:phosphatidylinositol kinase/protein kinase (PI-3  family)
MQLKDRHNSNILIDESGHIIHIDFGYVLGESPGFNINFENAPFKLTKEYIDVMGGVGSPAFRLFQELFYEGFKALNKNADLLTAILKLYDDTNSPQLVAAFKSR